MGAPYLLAHGLGRPVEDAVTAVRVPEAGTYRVWVRAKDWVPAYHPGRFTVSVNGTEFGAIFGANGADWSWQCAGTVALPAGEATVRLHDLTGFDGRCAAVLLTTGEEPPPSEEVDDASAWRRGLLGAPKAPAFAGAFDLVVVGGGLPGCATALAAARFGCKVALIHDMPILGGDASREVGILPRGESGPLVDEIAGWKPDGELNAAEALGKEPNVSLFLEHRAVGAVMEGKTIRTVRARGVRSGAELEFRAPVFADCTGMAVLALLSGAETRSGREGQSEYDESLAPARADGMHHGNTVVFHTSMAPSPVDFPDVPWATEVAGDYADLGGQLKSPGMPNLSGPHACTRTRIFPEIILVGRKSGREKTHFWEYGQWLDPYTKGEHIRDHLFCAIYGTVANLKRLEPETYANLMLDWMSPIVAHGGYRRIVGDYILTENDIRSHTPFPDAAAVNSGGFCLHYPGDRKHDFRIKKWIWDGFDGKPYVVPFRCLYSVNVPNLMMASKHISVSHIASSSTKTMLNGAQCGIAVAAAAALHKKYGSLPREIGKEHLAELQGMVERVTGKDLRGRRGAAE